MENLNKRTQLSKHTASSYWETVVKAVKASGHKQLAEELAREFGVTITW